MPILTDENRIGSYYPIELRVGCLQHSQLVETQYRQIKYCRKYFTLIRNKSGTFRENSDPEKVLNHFAEIVCYGTCVSANPTYFDLQMSPFIWPESKAFDD